MCSSRDGSSDHGLHDKRPTFPIHNSVSDELSSTDQTGFLLVKILYSAFIYSQKKSSEGEESSMMLLNSILTAVL
jgi:hypothetical protein